MDSINRQGVERQRRIGRHRGRGGEGICPETLMEGPERCFRPPDLMVLRLSKWILRNPEGLLALKIELMCPETPRVRGGGAVAPPDSLKYAYVMWGILLWQKKKNKCLNMYSLQRQDKFVMNLVQTVKLEKAHISKTCSSLISFLPTRAVTTQNFVNTKWSEQRGHYLICIRCDLILTLCIIITEWTQL